MILDEIQDKTEALAQYLGNRNYHITAKTPPSDRIAEFSTPSFFVNSKTNKNKT